jgi:hypothetical protein
MVPDVVSVLPVLYIGMMSLGQYGINRSKAGLITVVYLNMGFSLSGKLSVTVISPVTPSNVNIVLSSLSTTFCMVSLSLAANATLKATLPPLGH